MDVRLLQICDSMFPVGVLSHSFGLETLVAEGKVTKLNLDEYMAAMLRNQLGPCDMVFMLNAHRDIENAAELSRLYGCHRPVPEFYSASLKIGRRVLQLGYRLTGDRRLMALLEEDIHQPVAFGAVSDAMGINEEDAAYGFLYSWTASTASAAIRLMPLGHDAAQEIIYKTCGIIGEIYLENKDRDARNAWQYAPESEVAGVEHQKLYTRLFLS